MKVTRILSALLALAICTSAMTACQTQGGSSTSASSGSSSSAGSSSGDDAGTGDDRELVGNTYKTGLPIVKDTEKFRIVVERHPMDKTKSFSEKAVVQKIQQETNMEIEWVEVLNGDLEQKIPLILAADMPDAFLGDYTLGSNFGKNLKSFVSLEPYMEEGWLPNVVSDYEKANEILGFNLMDEMSRQEDGNVYALIGGTLTNEDSDVKGVQFINQKWLDNVGLGIPTNQDEFYTVLKAFKEQDANGNGDPNDEFPLEFCNNFWAGGFMNMFSYWGFTATTKVEDGKLIPTVNTEDFKNALIFYNKLAQEGLLDVEGFSQTREQFASKVTQGRVGIALFWSPTEFISDETALDYVFMPPFAADGYTGKPQLSGRYNTLGAKSKGFVVTTACKNPTAMLRWWDYLSSDTLLKNEFNYGLARTDENPTGLFKEENGKYVYLHDGDYTADFTIENAKYTYQIHNHTPLMLPGEAAASDPEPGTVEAIRPETVAKALEFVPREGMPYRSQPADKSAELALKTTDLNGFINNFIATSIVEGITDASWNKYLEDLEKYNYGYYVQYYQDFLDGKF